MHTSIQVRKFKYPKLSKVQKKPIICATFTLYYCRLCPANECCNILRWMFLSSQFKKVSSNKQLNSNRRPKLIIGTKVIWTGCLSVNMAFESKWGLAKEYKEAYEKVVTWTSYQTKRECICRGRTKQWLACWSWEGMKKANSLILLSHPQSLNPQDFEYFREIVIIKLQFNKRKREHQVSPVAIFSESLWQAFPGLRMRSSFALITACWLQLFQTILFKIFELYIPWFRFLRASICSDILQHECHVHTPYF